MKKVIEQLKQIIELENYLVKHSPYEHDFDLSPSTIKEYYMIIL